MATELKMPQMGYDMEEGTVVRWLKEEGSLVSKNEPVAEIETDKAVVEFESEVGGTLLKIVATEGTIVPVGQTIAVVGSETEVVPPQSSAADSDASEPVEEVSNELQDHNKQDVFDEITAELDDYTDQRILATPVARRIADETGIDLRGIQGTGPGGRITKKDVETFDPERVSVAAASSDTDPKILSREEISAPTTVSPSIEPLSRMRQQIARVTVKSKTEKPHFYVSAEINMSNAMSLRKQINEQMKDEAIRITVNDLIVKA